MSQVYINAIGAYLPNDPISNEEMEDYLGLIHGKPSSSKPKILDQNGIRYRYYALDKQQKISIGFLPGYVFFSG